MSTAAVLTLVLLQTTEPSAREVVRAIDYAADRGRLDSVEAAWRARSPPRIGARTRRLAQATLAAYRYRFAEAERTLLDLRRESLGDDVARRAALDLARLKLAQGYTGGAIPLLAQAEREARTAFDTLTLVEVLLAKTDPIERMSGPAAGLALLDSAGALGSASDLRSSIAPQCRRGGLLHASGDHRRARDVLRRAVARANEGGLRRTEARCRLALMVSFIATGETDSMRVQRELVEPLATGPGDLGALGATLQWTGTYLVRLGRPALARANLDSAVKLGRRTHNDALIAWAAYTLSEIALDFGDAKGAFSWLTLCDSLMRARGDAFGTAQTPALFGRLAWLRGDYESALRLTDSVVALAGRSGNPTAQVAAHEQRRWVAVRMGHVAIATDALLRRRDLTTRFQLRGYEPALMRAQAEHELWGGAFNRADSLFAAFGVTLHRTQHALKHDVLMYRALGKVLAGEVAAGERLARDAGAEYVQWRASLTDPDDRKRAAQSSVAFGDPYGLPRVIAELGRNGRAGTALELSEQRRALQLRETLARASGAAGEAATTSASAEGPRLDVRQLQALIPDGETAVLEYVLGVGDAATTLLVVTRDTVAAFDLGPARALAQSVTRFASLLEARQDARQLARQLGDLLIQPAQSLLARGYGRLVIIPDGALNFVPFDALILSDGRYVVDVFETSLVPSLAIAGRWWEQRQVAGPDRASLVLGDPAYPRESALPRLPGSGREAKGVARWLGNTELALGSQASEERLKRANNRELRVLHVASHAVVDDWSSDRSFIALAAGSGHDGLVSTSELSALGLRASLVVLSACKTARGEIIGGEGVQSLAQPFLEHGARALVATTWAVEDRRAAALIDRFYGALSRGTPVGSALREAKLALKKSGASPTDWGAYVLLGDALLRIAPAASTAR